MALIDVHAHFLPSVYREALGAAGIERPDGMPAVPAWSAEAHLDLLGRCGIDTAVLSISSPGVDLTGSRSDAVDLAAAGSADPTAIAALLELVDRSRVLYGSDWPFTPAGAVAGGLDWLRSDANPVDPDLLGANAADLLGIQP